MSSPRTRSNQNNCPLILITYLCGYFPDVCQSQPRPDARMLASVSSKPRKLSVDVNNRFVQRQQFNCQKWRVLSHSAWSRAWMIVTRSLSPTLLIILSTSGCAKRKHSRSRRYSNGAVFTKMAAPSGSTHVVAAIAMALFLRRLVVERLVELVIS